MDEEELPNDVERLKLIISDLSRRLQNAQLTIESERSIAENALVQTEIYKTKVLNISNILRLEKAKNANLERKRIQDVETQKFEKNKKLAAELHDELRIVELDHLMTGFRNEPLNLTKLRKKLESMEQEQNSQKTLLQQLVAMDKLNEELSTAAQNGNFEECQILIQCGASVHYVDVAGYIPLHYAIANNFYDIIKFFLEKEADYSSYLTGHSPMVIAATYGHTHIMKLLLDFGANIEDKGSGGCPAVIVALQNNQIECMVHILNHFNADINAVDANEDSLLHTAVKIPDPVESMNIVQYLLSRDGVITDRINKQSLTPYQIALYNKNRPIMDLLNSYSAAQKNNLANGDAMSVGSFGRRSVGAGGNKRVGSLEIGNGLLQDSFASDLLDMVSQRDELPPPAITASSASVVGTGLAPAPSMILEAPFSSVLESQLGNANNNTNIVSAAGETLAEPSQDKDGIDAHPIDNISVTSSITNF